MLAPPTLAELAAFTGRAESSFTSYSTQSLAQATLLLEIVTGIKEYPTDPALLQLAKNGILSWADYAYLSQPYQDLAASPYQSENIASYSYSLKLQAAKKGLETGIFWFDLAVKKLKTKSVSEVGHGSIAMSEWDGVVMRGGKAYFPGPKGRSRRRHRQYENPDNPGFEIPGGV